MSKNSINVAISVSIIATDLSLIGESVKTYNADCVDYLHMDVMDGHFVPNLTFGPGFIKNLRKNTDIPLDIHLMIEKPENSIEEYIETDPWGITIHYESTKFPIRVLNQIRNSSIKAGISLNPSTPVESIYNILPYIDLVLIMSVDPGFYGQSFMEMSLDKIGKLSKYIDNSGFEDKIIQVDGGINRDNICSVVKAGARIIAIGSSVFKGSDINTNIKELKSISSIP